MNKIALALLFGVFVGCITSTWIQAFVIPRAYANQKTKWQYKCISHVQANIPTMAKSVDSMSNPDGWEKVLNQSGSEGWEAAQYFYDSNMVIRSICFKREA